MVSDNYSTNSTKRGHCSMTEETKQSPVEEVERTEIIERPQQEEPVNEGIRKRKRRNDR